MLPACTVLLYSILRRLKKANATFCTTRIPTIVFADVLGVICSIRLKQLPPWSLMEIELLSYHEISHGDFISR